MESDEHSKIKITQNNNLLMAAIELLLNPADI